MSDLPWIEKYRPKTLNDVIGHDIKISVLKNMLEKKNIPHLLFYGPPGTGKTSTIIALAKDLYGSNYKNFVKELNASDDRGIDTVRTTIIDFCKRSTNRNNDIKIIILDEVDSMTNEAQNALRGVMEQYNKTTRFCLTCNNINLIISGLRSRCVEMKFHITNDINSCIKIENIFKNENININTQIIQNMLNIKNDYRSVINDIQIISCFNNNITMEIIYDYLGIPNNNDIQNILDIIHNNDLIQANILINQIYKQNKWILNYLINRLMDIYIYKNDINFKNIKKINYEKFINTVSDVKNKINSGYDSEIYLSKLILAFY
jgi:replication factor C subunit 3/5